MTGGAGPEGATRTRQEYAHINLRFGIASLDPGMD